MAKESKNTIEYNGFKLLTHRKDIEAVMDGIVKFSDGSSVDLSKGKIKIYLKG